MGRPAELTALLHAGTFFPGADFFPSSKQLMAMFTLLLVTIQGGEGVCHPDGAPRRAAL